MMQISRQKGFSIVSAIFLIVILAALGAFMIRMSAVQTESVALSIQASRIFQAARSGVEWGLNDVLDPVGNPAGNCFAPANFAVLGFTVDVTCASTDHPEGGQTQRVYEISSIARFGVLGSPTFVQRAVEVRATRAL